MSFSIEVISAPATDHCVKVPKYGVFSGLYFPAFGLNMEIYSVNLRIQSECEKILARRNFVFGHFSYSGTSATLVENQGCPHWFF